MGDFTPAFTHGDATTSNFVFPWDGGVVAIDWERFAVADPAADVGRFAPVATTVENMRRLLSEAEELIVKLEGCRWDAE